MSSWGVMEGHLGWGSCSTTTVVVVEEAEAEAEAAAAAAGYWRKGPWTAEEDKLLIQYVKLHGEGRWNSVSRLAGLKRNGKSCRLRWVNYLRPDLKRGQITPQEESIIVELHARWGNRWSTIARSLPGRTDNEIKNYWRTHFKKKTKLPLDNSEKARNRLLKRQQFHRQQKEQQELQLQQQQHQHQQQQQQLLWQLNQLDMKKIMSLLDDSTTTNINNNPMPQFSGRQEASSCCNPPTTVAYPNSSITGDQQHGIFFSNGMFSVVNNNNNNNATCGGGGVPTSSASSVMVAAGEASADEEVGIWDDDGLWNLEELHAAAVGSGRAANIPNLVAPFC